MLTVAEIKNILRQERLSISKRRGQNFLVERAWQEKIIAASALKKDDAVLEIGPGLGALTEELARQAGWVFAVEKDKALARILQQQLSGYQNLTILHQDILEVEIRKLTTQKIKVIGNLPYYITTPIIGYLLEKQLETITEIFITVQDEVGRRLAAKCGGKDYSSLSVLIQYFSRPKILFSIPKRAFYPQPRVDSVFVRLEILPEPSVKVSDQEQFFKIVHGCFRQRRKTILNSLAHQLSAGRKSEVAQALAEAGLDPGTRPEQLGLDEFAKIKAVFDQRRIKIE